MFSTFFLLSHEKTKQYFIIFKSHAMTDAINPDLFFSTKKLAFWHAILCFQLYVKLLFPFFEFLVNLIVKTFDNVITLDKFLI
jgi:hypothetical protein